VAKQLIQRLMQFRCRKLFWLALQPFMLVAIKLRMVLMLAGPDAITEIVLQELPITLFKTAVKALFTLIDAQFQCR
jgi:hypothetical protein